MQAKPDNKKYQGHRYIPPRRFDILGFFLRCADVRTRTQSMAVRWHVKQSVLRMPALIAILYWLFFFPMFVSPILQKPELHSEFSMDNARQDPCPHIYLASALPPACGLLKQIMHILLFHHCMNCLCGMQAKTPPRSRAPRVAWPLLHQATTGDLLAKK